MNPYESTCIQSLLVILILGLASFAGAPRYCMPLSDIRSGLAAELDIESSQLIVGSIYSSHLRLKNVGPVPLSFSVVLGPSIAYHWENREDPLLESLCHFPESVERLVPGQSLDYPFEISVPPIDSSTVDLVISYWVSRPQRCQLIGAPPSFEVSSSSRVEIVDEDAQSASTSN